MRAAPKQRPRRCHPGHLRARGKSDLRHIRRTTEQPPEHRDSTTGRQPQNRDDHPVADRVDIGHTERLSRLGRIRDDPDRGIQAAAGVWNIAQPGGDGGGETEESSRHQASGCAG